MENNNPPKPRTLTCSGCQSTITEPEPFYYTPNTPFGNIVTCQSCKNKADDYSDFMNLFSGPAGINFYEYKKDPPKN